MKISLRSRQPGKDLLGDAVLDSRFSRAPGLTKMPRQMQTRGACLDAHCEWKTRRLLRTEAWSCIKLPDPGQGHRWANPSVLSGSRSVVFGLVVGLGD